MRRQKATLGHIVLGALRHEKMCLVGTISSVKIIQRSSDVTQQYYNLSPVRNICARDRLGHATEVQLEPLWVAGAKTGTSGKELGVGSQIFLVAYETVGHLEELAVHPVVTPTFDKDADGDVSIKGQHSSIIVEQTKIRFANIPKVVANIINGEMRLFEDACFDAPCEIACVSHAYRNLGSQGEQCSAETDCYYGSECARVTLLDKPDVCTPCGDEPPKAEFIERTVDGVRRCWDPDTLAEIDCP